jgi:hypothetical protein
VCHYSAAPQYTECCRRSPSWQALAWESSRVHPRIGFSRPSNPLEPQGLCSNETSIWRFAISSECRSLPPLQNHRLAESKLGVQLRRQHPRRLEGEEREITQLLSIPKTRSRQTRDSTGELILPFSHLSRTRVTRPWPSVPKGRDWTGFVGSSCALGVDGIRRTVRIFRPDCLFKRLAARTGDEVHRLQNVQSGDQAREAERVATRGHLCRAPGECASAGNNRNRI